MALPTAQPTRLETHTQGEGYNREQLAVCNPITNTAFLSSPLGRSVRILAEFEEFPRRMCRLGVRGTFLLFGSARTLYAEDYADRVRALEEELKGAGESEEKKRQVQLDLEQLERTKWSHHWMAVTEELAFRLTEWARSPEGRRVGMQCSSKLFPLTTANDGWYGGQLVPLQAVSNIEKDGSEYRYEFEQPLIVCTGGGPGFMEAGNKGAYRAGGVSMGVGISLPFETELNKYVTPGLHFQTEYFFSRKYWEVFSAKAIIMCPGGMGTLDELFEVLTLMQCTHAQKMPVVLLDKTFWNSVINFDLLIERGMIKACDVKALFMTDSAEEAFTYIKNAIVKEVS